MIWGYPYFRKPPYGTFSKFRRVIVAGQDPASKLGWWSRALWSNLMEIVESGIARTNKLAASSAPSYVGVQMWFCIFKLKTTLRRLHVVWHEGNKWMTLAETIQSNEPCLFSRTLLQVGGRFFVRKISGGSNQFPFGGEDAAKEELTFIMRTIGCKNNHRINRAQLSQAIESSSAEDFNSLVEELNILSCKQHRTTSQWMVYVWW